MLTDFQSMKQRAETAEKINQDLRRKTDTLEADYETLKAKLSSIETLEGDKDALQRELAQAKAKLEELTKRLGADSFVNVEGIEPGDGTYINPETGGIVLPSKLLFPLGEWKLQARGRETVSTIAEKIKEKYPGHIIYVDGFTDRVPVKRVKKLCPDNWFLGFRRAYAVRNHLMNSGIKKETIVTNSFGYLREVEKDTIESERNRRVEIRVFKDFPKPTRETQASGRE